MTGERLAERASWRGGAISLAVIFCRPLAADVESLSLTEKIVLLQYRIDIEIELYNSS